MPRQPINIQDIFESLRKEDNITEDEEDEITAMFLSDIALDLERKQERKNVFMGKQRKKRNRQ